MLTDGKIDGVWLGSHLLQGWDSLCSYWELTLANLESWLIRSIFSWVQSWARTLGLQP